MSDKPWDADADLGSGRDLDLGSASAEPVTYEEILSARPEPVVTSEPPSQPRRRARTGGVGWVILLIILGSIAWPVITVVLALVSAVDEISEAVDFSQETTTEESPVATDNLIFLRTLDSTLSGTANALPQCFFDEAVTGFCSSTYRALADLVDSTSVTMECSGYRAFWVNALRTAADGRPQNLDAIYNDVDPASYPAGYADARTRCVEGG